MQVEDGDGVDAGEGLVEEDEGRLNAEAAGDLDDSYGVASVTAAAQLVYFAIGLLSGGSPAATSPEKTISVRAYDRRMSLPEHSFLRSALEDMTPAIGDAINAAVAEAISNWESGQ